MVVVAHKKTSVYLAKGVSWLGNGGIGALYDFAFVIFVTLSVKHALSQGTVLSPSCMDLVKEARFSSPSMYYVLEMVPDDRMGLGRYGASYRFLQDGILAWSGERPYTLRNVVITDDGIVTGVAYRSEFPMLYENCDPHEYMHVVILDCRGKEVLYDTVERPELPFSSSPPLLRRPIAEQLIVHSEADRLVVRVIEPGGLIGRCVWLVYQLSTGQLVQRFDPSTLIPASPSVAWVSDVQPISGTPLFLVHSIVRQMGQWGARFVIIDNEMRGVWELRLREDYKALDWRHLANEYNCLYQTTSAYGNFSSYLSEHGVIRIGPVPKQFEIRSFLTNECMIYVAEKVDGAAWLVLEMSRTKCMESND